MGKDLNSIYGGNIVNIKVVTKDYMATNGDHYYLVSFNVINSQYVKGKRYGAISYDEVEDNGMIKRSMNAYEMHMNETIAKVIEDIEFRTKIKETSKAEGISKMAAMLLIQGGRSKAECVKLAEELEGVAEKVLAK